MSRAIMYALHVCLALAFTAPPGNPEEGVARAVGVVAVAPAPGPTPELVEMTLQLRERIAEHRPGTVDARELRARMTGQAPGASLAELDRAYEGAHAAQVNGDYEGSLRTLRTIVAELENLPDGAEVFSQWTRAMMRLARSEQSLGHEKEAAAAIGSLVRAAPDVAVDRALYPPRFVREVEKVRTAVKTAPTSPLTVTSSAEDARVFVNGRAVGTAPVRLALPHGRWRISGTHGALRAAPVSVDLEDEAQEVHLDFTIPEAMRPALGPGLALPDEGRSRRIVVAGAHLRLDDIVAVTVVDADGATHVVGSLYDVRRGMLVREGRVRLTSGTLPVGGTSALAEFLVTGEARSVLVEVEGRTRSTALKPIPTAAPKPEPLVDLRPQAADPSTTRTLRWSALATGVAAAGFLTFGIVESTSASGTYDEARKLRAAGLSTNDAIAAYNAKVTEGDAAARRAKIGWFGAGATVAATAILTFVNYQRTGEFAPFRF